MMKERGYNFITLEQALKDNAYRMPDNHVGLAGTSWLHHWAEAKGVKIKTEPDIPQFVVKLSEFKDK